MPDQRYTRLMRLGGDSLQSAQSLAGKCVDLLGDVLRDCGNGVILLDLDPHHARCFGRAIAPGERCPKRNRDLAEDRSWNSPAQRAFDPVECLYDFDLAR